jgi:hypothetical protein
MTMTGKVLVADGTTNGSTAWMAWTNLRSGKGGDFRGLAGVAVKAGP